MQRRPTPDKAPPLQNPGPSTVGLSGGGREIHPGGWNRMVVVPEPALQLSRTTEFDPDIAVARRRHVGAAKLTEPPLLTVEIRSPSTALIGLNRKKAAYEAFGVPSYWIVVPDIPQPRLTAFDLTDGQYREAAHVTGGQVFRAQWPFPVDVVPEWLVAGLDPQ